jgi:hypothetical protein
MKRSDDLVIGRPGDRKNGLTAETRRHGEETLEHLTTEASRRGKSCSSRDFFDHPITRAISAPAVFRRIICTLRATLREIFDESAYDRFLLQTGDSRSSESYRAFMQEKEREMARRPKCC